MPNLRLAAHAGGGLPGAEVLARHGIPTITQIEANSVPTAEYSVAMILLANKRAFTAQSRYRETRGYLDREVHFLDSGNYESRVGIVGAGHVGRAVLNLLQPYDIELVVADPALDAREVERLGARKVELPELLATSDVVSLHAPEMPSTRHLIGPDQLATMRDGATLINSARGGLIDQAALSTELLSGRIGAVLDVAEPDVLPAENLLFDLPNVVLTPHIAGSMGRELHRLADLNIADIRSHLRSPARVA
jgi:phosphoglycerate dehydrogenase-like enzyme